MKTTVASWPTFPVITINKTISPSLALLGYTQPEVSQVNLILDAAPIGEATKEESWGRKTREGTRPLCPGSNPGSATQPDRKPATAPPRASVSLPVKRKQ